MVYAIREIGDEDAVEYEDQLMIVLRTSKVRVMSLLPVLWSKLKQIVVSDIANGVLYRNNIGRVFLFVNYHRKRLPIASNSSWMA